MEQHKSLPDLDLISQLPDGLLTSILSYLPIQEAARTSILSRRWKSLWLTLPSLELDESLGFNSETLEEISLEDISSDDDDHPLSFFSNKFDSLRWLAAAEKIFAARVPSICQHPIIECNIRFKNFTENSFLFSNILQFLCNSGIKILEILNYNDDQYQIPTDVFFCSSLQALILDTCSIRLPGKLTGWHALKTIALYSTFVSDSDLIVIMTYCRALESLHLFNCDGFEKIVVSAPRLLNFELRVFNKEISISLANASNIRKIWISIACLIQPPNVEKDGHNLFEMLMNIPRVEYLCLQVGISLPSDT